MTLYVFGYEVTMGIDAWAGKPMFKASHEFYDWDIYVIHIWNFWMQITQYKF